MLPGLAQAMSEFLGIPRASPTTAHSGRSRHRRVARTLRSGFSSVVLRRRGLTSTFVLASAHARWARPPGRPSRAFSPTPAPCSCSCCWRWGCSRCVQWRRWIARWSSWYRRCACWRSWRHPSNGFGRAKCARPRRSCARARPTSRPARGALFADELRYTLPSDPALLAGRRFVRGEVLGRDPQNLDRLEVALESSERRRDRARHAGHLRRCLRGPSVAHRVGLPGKDLGRLDHRAQSVRRRTPGLRRRLAPGQAGGRRRVRVHSPRAPAAGPSTIPTAVSSAAVAC